MQDKALLTSPTPISSVTAFIDNKSHNLQHVPQPNRQSSSLKRPSNLFSLPGESLTHITAYVDDPSSLLTLSRVNRRLRDHVADDNTWYLAFAFHFWRVGPESTPVEKERLLLRRSESTWKKEFVKRYNMIRRWEKSRNSILSYQPHYWSVSSMHLLENVSLMTANLQYGIVTRSFPLTGKILKGYLDASGTANGLGIGNPNEEFSPNVSCIALSSCGGTGRIAWGFRNGQVAATSASRVMDSNRSAARYTRCVANDEHAGDVRCVQFAGREDDLIISGCSHGETKLWDARRMSCLWTGYGKKTDAILPDPCVKAEYCAKAGVAVAALQSGDIMVWSGFQLRDEGAEVQVVISTVHELRIAHSAQSISLGTNLINAFVDPLSSPSKVAILVHHANERYFLRLAIDLPSCIVTSTKFLDGPLGALTSLKPCFAVQDRSSSSALVSPTPVGPVGSNTSSLSIGLAADPVISRESSFILAGDSLGRVCAWHWNAEGYTPGANPEHAHPPGEVTMQVNSSHKWEAHDDGAVCAIEVNSVVIVTGSSHGTLKVWDCLTFAPLRSFASPAPKPSVSGQWDPVGKIILRGNLLVANVGSRILVWQAGPVTTHKKSKLKHVGKPRGKGSGNTMNKWQQQIELNRDIRESLGFLDDERANTQRVYGRAREQLSSLDQLGLSETEAVQYLLMLSREEKDQRRLSEFTGGQASTRLTVDGASATSGEDLEGVFTLEGYFELGQQRPGAHGLGSSSPRASSSLMTRTSPPAHRTIPSSSNSKVQVSPPFLREPSGAGSIGSPLSRSAFASGSTSPVPMGSPRNSGAPTSVLSTPASSFDDQEAFPAMGPSSGTPSLSTPSRSVSSLQLSGSWTRGSPSNSFRTTACSSPTTRSASGTSQTLSSSVSHSSLSMEGSHEEIVSRRREEEEDDELRYVLELSLAEARSRGEL